MPPLLRYSKHTQYCIPIRIYYGKVGIKLESFMNEFSELLLLIYEDIIMIDAFEKVDDYLPRVVAHEIISISAQKK